MKDYQPKVLQPHPDAKGLIFDLDGTLLDSLELNWQALDTAFKAHGAQIDRNYFLSLTGRSIEEIVAILVDKYNVCADPAAITAEKRRLVNDRLDEVQAFTVVADVAKKAHGNLKLAVGTGSDMDRAVRMLRSTHLLNLFDTIVSADDVANHKPAPDTFLECARRMGLKPSECQVFEDGEPGLCAARTAGMIVTDVRPYQ